MIFDSKTVDDPSTFANPHAYASGIEDVVVNGVFVVHDGTHTGARPGHMIQGAGFSARKDAPPSSSQRQ